MGEAEDAARRRKDDTSAAMLARQNVQRAELTAEGVKLMPMYQQKIDDALTTLASRGYPATGRYRTDISIEWEGERRAAWHLIECRALELRYDVYLLSTGVVVRSDNTGTSEVSAIVGPAFLGFVIKQLSHIADARFQDIPHQVR